ncbi:hybrid sensor histidine kinase/response regulator [Sphingopyxis sp. L1A2A]|uniref:ATP-binding response regulator n=1 Tax=Sphingopyxis sp. L1A2A TaxID=2502247 RepID=UPI001484EEFB|nr:hybrid sensor histidine kinase/response regulator [Sphingopyxis sp. L1A2A]
MRYGQFAADMGDGAARLFQRAVSTPVEDELEHKQAWIRLALLVLISTYATVASIIVAPEHRIEPWAIAVLSYFACYTPLALGLLYNVRRYPGHYPARRLFSMANDYAGLAFAIIAGCVVMLPVYAIIMWVTVGNGLRFGSRYMIVAAIMAQITLATITLLTPYWQANPPLVVTLSLTALIVPLYIRTLQRSTEQARRDAEEANTAKSRFLAQASHDLRQPVHAIGLFLNSLTQTGLAPEQRGIVDRIDRSLQGVAELFRSLLDISTLDSGAVTPKLEPVSIGQLFRLLEQQNQVSAEWAGIDLRFVQSDRVVLADKALLLTMLQNLVSNAIKYAPRGPVLIGCRPRGEYVSIWVVDCGPGIAAEHLPRLFDEFYQIRKLGSADTQGVGLGLSIVRRLGALMDFDAEVRSRPGHGTAVAIHGLVAAAAAVPQVVDRDNSYAAPLHDLRVLLVEDDIDVLDATAHLLRSWGAQVAAWSIAPPQAQPCDLIVTDFDIGGGMTGADCIALHRHVSPPPMAIVMTGHDEMAIEEIIADAGVLILKKPVQPAELRSAIAALRSRQERLPTG